MGGGADVRGRIEEYVRQCRGSDPSAVADLTRRALRDRHYLLVARAAELAGERLLIDLEPDLISAYRRLLDKPVKRDPGCTAKGAIARALVALDCQDAGFFVAGTRYAQPEPVWGGTVDTAVDLRITCATGLVNTAYPRALVELAVLLHDPEPHVRSGAARALACAEPLAAEALLRSRILAGDSEPEVMGDYLSALLQAAGELSIDFVARFLDHPNPAIAELAALALGESRLDEALELLRGRWEEQPLKRDADRVLLRAAVLHRSEAAYDWLLAVVAEGDGTSAELVVSELAAWRGNRGLRRRLRAALDRRDDPSLWSRFGQSWGEDVD